PLPCTRGEPRVSTPAITLRLPVASPAVEQTIIASLERPEATGHGEAGPASKRVVAGFGFWIFLISDIVMFSAFFSCYPVLSGSTAGGPTAAQLFDLNNVALETGCLLLSSFFCGMASLAVEARNLKLTQLALLATGVLGLAFLVLELREFADLIAQGAGP